MAPSTYIARLTKAIVLGLTVAALGAMAAQASQPVVRDAVDRYLANHQSAMPDAVDRLIANYKAHVLRLDNRADGVDRAVANHRADLTGQGTAQASRSSNATRSTGFDWRPAGVGASMISTLLLLAGWGLALARRATRKRRAFGVQ